MLLTKFLRVAVAGNTIDGREITDKQIDEMAASYNPATYGARIWMEHLRGLLPDSLFPAYGDVTAVKAQDWTDPSDGQTKRALYAQLAPTPELVKANEAKQKVYFSIEMAKNFAGRGTAYLAGLAVTDTPASLGTEMLAFSLQHRAEFKGECLPSEDTLFSAAIESTFELAGDPPPADTETLFTKVKNLLRGAKRVDEERLSDMTQAVELLADEVRQQQSAGGSLTEARVRELVTEALGAAQPVADLNEKVTALTTRLAALEDGEDPNRQGRPAATGGDGQIVTDC